jgi:hypothetical protein
MTDVERGNRVRLTQEGVDAWFVANETTGSAVSEEATIREIYGHYKPKLEMSSMNKKNIGRR